MKKILFVLFILNFGLLFSQKEQRIDSLLQVAVSWHYPNPSGADSLYKIILEEAKEMDYTTAIGLAEKGRGVIADVRGNPEKAMEHYEVAFKVFIDAKDSMNAYKVRYNEGIIYRSIKKSNLASKAFQECKEVFEKYGFIPGVILSDINFGILQYDEKNYNGALEKFHRARRIQEKMGQIDPNIYMNIGNCFFYLEQDDSSFFYLEKAYKLAMELGNYVTITNLSNTLGQLYYKKGELKKAEELFLQEISISIEKEQWDQVADAKIYISTLYRDLASFEKAYTYLAEGIKLRDSLRNQEFLMELSEKDAVIDNEKKQHEIALLEEQEQRSQEEISFVKKTRIYLGIVIGLVLIVTVLILLQSLRRRKINRLLTDKNEQIEEQHKEITDSINYARQIQTALLTSDAEWSKISPEFFILFKPKDVVSGDFFWALEHEEEGLSIWVAADCTGHGVPGAFMSMLGIGFLNEIIIENKILEPQEVLNKLREKIISALKQKNLDTERKDGIDLALCVWEKKTNTLTFAGANNPLYIIRNKESIKETDPLKESNEQLGLLEFLPDKMPVGSHTGELRSFSQTKIQLNSGDMIYTFSDGYADQFGGDQGKKYKYKRFREHLMSIAHLSAEDQNNNLDIEFESWKGQLEQIDDVCVIGVRV
ncbi:MAG: SpoIIE family protein phosphatase [Crocinitomicaceae bacterium]|nr:SpoIIE family protein phosphatase [Crocinitomicaceae bacterium]